MAENVNKQATVEGLTSLLADTYTLYMKTQNFHWNVTGPQFQSLHALFESQYTELALAIDTIAERIRALGAPAPGSYTAFAALTSLEQSDDIPQAEDMVRELSDDQGLVAERARGIVAIAGESHDQVSEDLAISRLAVHEKNAWMLRSSVA